jgi:hypothetical protein
MSKSGEKLNLSRKESVLYITYDSMLEPLGHSQVFRYIESLAVDFRFFLISFEREARGCPMKRALLSERFAQLGVTWVPMRYHKRPRVVATLYDVCRCVCVALFYIVRNKIRVVHARSFVSVFMAFIIKIFVRLQIIYDMRGFWVEERLAAGFLRENTLMLSVLRQLDKYFLTRSSHIVVLTQSALNVLKKDFKLLRNDTTFSVIPTCVSLEQFTLEGKSRPDNGCLVVGYVGSVSVTNMFYAFILLLIQLKSMRINFRVLIINKGEHRYIRAELAGIGLEDDIYELLDVDHCDVHKSLGRIDFAVFFKKNGLSSIGCSPTRFSEFMASGVPCFFNTGIGDLDYFTSKCEVGVSVSSFTEEALRVGIRDMLELLDDNCLSNRCRRVAERYFPVARGVQCYALIYSNLLALRA